MANTIRMHDSVGRIQEILEIEGNDYEIIKAVAKQVHNENVADPTLQWSNYLISWPKLPLEEKERAMQKVFERTQQIYSIHIRTATILRGLEHRLYRNRANWQLYMRGRAASQNVQSNPSEDRDAESSQDQTRDDEV